MNYPLDFYAGMHEAEQRGCILIAECHHDTPIRIRNGKWEYYAAFPDAWQEMPYSGIDQMRRGNGTQFRILVDPEQLAKVYLFAASQRPANLSANPKPQPRNR